MSKKQKKASKEKKAPKATDEVVDCKKKLNEEKEKSNRFQEQVKYMQADLDNLEKYYKKQNSLLKEKANESLINDLLPSFEDLERAIITLKESKDKDGVKLIFKEFRDTLVKNGLEIIETVGTKFNPDFHEVIGIEKSNLEEGTIIKEIVRGYLLNKKILRHSKVIISGEK
ncbi:MAG: nucleotide exchange factor GrpE [Candidatus Ranarchaeia archaeon]